MKNESVYKVFIKSEWEDFKTKGSSSGAPVDLQDGFIHLSKNDQLKRVIDKYFSHTRPIYIVEFSDEKFLLELKYEQASNGDFFPHLYGRDLLLSEIETVQRVD